MKKVNNIVMMVCMPVSGLEIAMHNTFMRITFTTITTTTTTL